MDGNVCTLTRKPRDFQPVRSTVHFNNITREQVSNPNYNRTWF
jgi:hypothetical protein